MHRHFMFKLLGSVAFCTLLLVAHVNVAYAEQPRSGAARNTQMSNPQSAASFLRVAQRLHNKGDYSAAANFYQRVLELENANDQALAGLGDIMLMQGASLPALEHFQRWALLKPKDARPHLAIAQLYNRADQPMQAYEALDRAQALGASQAQILLERGLTFDLNGTFSAAQALYTQAHKLDPQALEIKLRLALSLALSEDYQAALQVLQQAYSQNAPSVERVRRTLALVYALSGQARTALNIEGRGERDDVQTAQQLAFFEQLAKLSARDKARAVYLGVLPARPPSLAGNDAILKAIEQGQAKAPTPQISTAQVPLVQAPRMIALPQGQKLEQEAAPEGARPKAPTAAPANIPAMRAVPLPALDRHWAQLALEPNRAGLLKSWEQINAQTQGALQDFPPYLQQTMVNGRPMVRLMVGGYSEADTARALVERLQSFGLKAVLNRNAAPADPLFP